MLSFYVTFSDGSEAEINHLISAVYNSDIDVPADNLTLTVIYDKRLGESVRELRVYQDGALIFKGQVDEVINLKQDSGMVTQISARSLAALLLDNEAEPLDYNNPASDFIFRRHLKPFGITQYSADKKPLLGRLRIDKGMSHWQVLQSFCKSKYGCEPRINGDGRAFFSGFSDDEKVVFSDTDSGIVYDKIREMYNRYNLISEVAVKLLVCSAYRSSVKNSNPECDGITRKRYVDASADNNSLDTAYKIIDRGNRKSYLIQLECAGCYLGLLGKKAALDDSVLGVRNNLEVRKIKYQFDKNGEYTTVILGKESK